MNFRELDIPGVYVIEPERIADERGYFARTWCFDEFQEHGIDASFVQCNTSFNHKKGTLRGLHYQAPPYGEAKLIRCTRGRMFDVALDMRGASASFGKWVSVDLSADSGRMLFLPKGVAHGFQTLEDATEVFYQMSEEYQPGAAVGVRWNDPALAIPWPLPKPVMSERDKGQPLHHEIQI